MKVISSGKTPPKIKCSTLQTFIVIMKNVNFKKYFLTTSPLSQIKDIINLCLEACQVVPEKVQQSPSEDASPDVSPTEPSDIELYQVSLRFLINLLCLPQSHILGTNHRKFYIPGETMENERMRQKAIEYGLLSVLAWIDCQLKNDELKSLLSREFWGALDSEDFTLWQQKGKVEGTEWDIKYDQVEALIKEKH